MKFSFLFSFFLLTLNVTFGQSDEKAFIQDFFLSESIQAKPPILISDIGNFFSEEIHNRLRTMKDTLRVRKRIDNKIIVTDSIILSLEERIFLINKFEQGRTQIDGFKYIPLDTLTAIFNDKSKGWSFFNKTYGNRFYSFSTPIFLRNNTLCAFFYSMTCGSWCGEGTFAIYRKENGKWVFLILLYRMIT